ncbi:MAG: hypothetical protein ACTSVZ_09225 [Promethearchaeota archaeon]
MVDLQVNLTNNVALTNTLISDPDDDISLDILISPDNLDVYPDNQHHIGWADIHVDIIKPYEDFQSFPVLDYATIDYKINFGPILQTYLQGGRCFHTCDDAFPIPTICKNYRYCGKLSIISGFMGTSP